MFVRYSLRTVEVESARRFYGDALGLVLPEGASPDSALEAWPLHERALVAGAPPHWLGHLEVEDLEGAVSEMLGAGAQPLGPTVTGASGSWATLRDPFGAVVALRQRASAQALSHRPFAWHQLHTTDLDRAWPLYASVAGFTDAGSVDHAGVVGGHRLFGVSDQPLGSMANTARWPGVHPHWLFYFPVADLDAAVERVRVLGGTAQLPDARMSGRRVAVCEDPQRAAFGLMEVSP
jgi:hypothetical protein